MIILKFLIFYIFIILIQKLTQKQIDQNLFCKKPKLNLVNIKNPKVSIIIPVYNTEEFLNSCLDSLINQTLKEIEIICVDDGSTDDSLFILNHYSKIDSRIIVLKQKNKGAGVARNYGMSIAKGEYLSFLDSDDFFNKNLLTETVEKADETFSDIIIYNFQKYNQKTGKFSSSVMRLGKELWSKRTFNYSDFPEKIFNYFYPCAWNKLFRSSFIKNNNLYFQNNFRTNDLFFTITALASASKIYFLNKSFVYYRTGLLNNSQSTNYLYPMDFYKALFQIKKFLEEKNLYSKLLFSYKKLVTNIIIYNIRRNQEKDIYVYEQLKNGKFESLGI